MKSIIVRLKKETTLCVAWLLALISAFIVLPGKEYIAYIDFRSLGILWSLMIITQGLKKENVFTRVGVFLLQRTKKLIGLEITLVFLCFVSSMLITNDVALITFVPFAIFILQKCGQEKLILTVVVLQTLAANLGSMLTPIGNPQNLYLFGLSEMNISEFILLMLPYTIASGIIILIIIFTLPEKNTEIQYERESCKTGSTRNILIYGGLFIVGLCSVLHLLDYRIFVFLVATVALIMDKSILKRADYALLLTFIGFFIFTGNMGRIPMVIQLLNQLIMNREVGIGILLSQCISNVPAALLLSDFTTNYRPLIVGVNLGGLGTLIASMASLISFKQFALIYPQKKGKYLFVFSAINIVVLIILITLNLIIK